MNDTVKLIRRYFAAFNDGNIGDMLDCLDDGVVHDVNQGERRQGKKAFAAFCRHMARCYAEQLHDIVIMSNDDGSRASAEFVVEGRYLADDEGLPPADGQTYRLPAGTFFEIGNGRIRRVTTFYNLQEWIRQVQGP
ncbi:MAG: nuclear transport factor 2 family protein [Geminicoccaceae bacterium]|nr:nuclear transport factor 2 family protein [Geminicoccaceae bacterium]